MRGDGFDVRCIRQVGVGHDRGGVAVDEDDAIALLPQNATRLGAGIIELTRLTDDDGTRTDNEDGADISSFGHEEGSRELSAESWKLRVECSKLKVMWRECGVGCDELQL